jgi:uncharacterized OB-fold protein
MKRSLSIALAALVVLALPVMAQQTQQELEGIEQRTNPDARSVGPGAGLTLTGTVVEFNDQQLVVQTTTGRQHFQLIDLQVPTGVQVGDRVAIDYTRTEQGVMIAREVRPFTMGATQVTVGDVLSTTGTVVEITDEELVLRTELGLQRFRLDEVQLPAGVRVGDRVTVEFVRTEDGVMTVRTVRVLAAEEVAAFPATTTDTTTDTTLRSDVLPATGSSLPRVALFGLLALLAAASLRLFRV